MTDAYVLFIVLAAAYLAGSVNVSIVLFKILKRDDPRNHFSGNAGATNVYRQAGLGWAGLVLFLDAGRALAVSGAALYLLALPLVPWVGLALLLGNRFPCFHGFRGGKGVATYLGFTTLIAPMASLLSTLVWLGIYRLVRIPFIASLSLTLVLLAGTIGACGVGTIPMAGAIATVLFIFSNHRKNIAELWFSRSGL